MKCAEAEILLCDYLDGTLPSGQRNSFEQHLIACAACSELARDAQAAVAFLAEIPEVEPPAELMTRILFHAPELAPEPKRGGRAGNWWSAWMGSLLQPRLAMGMAMTILSFSLVAQITGLPQRQLTLADLEPVRVWSTVDMKMARTWDRAVKYYENLRLVYEIQMRLREWSDQEEEDRRTQSQSATIEVPTQGTKSPQGAGGETR